MLSRGTKVATACERNVLLLGSSDSPASASLIIATYRHVLTCLAFSRQLSPLARHQSSSSVTDVCPLCEEPWLPPAA